MDGLRVVPAWRHGQERLYVCLPDGRNIAWYDREAARVNLLGEDREDEVLRALGPFITGPVTVGPPPVPTPAELARLALHPDDDLAPNRPGEALLVALDRDPGPARRLRADPRRRALEAQQAVGDALDRLDGAGWHALHSVPLP
ncbi:NERD domain-containing protein, partial [Streptomyces sp. NPDC006129]